VIKAVVVTLLVLLALRLVIGFVRTPRRGPGRDGRDGRDGR
jgi:hypothetical protein